MSLVSGINQSHYVTGYAQTLYDAFFGKFQRLVDPTLTLPLLWTVTGAAFQVLAGVMTVLGASGTITSPLTQPIDPNQSFTFSSNVTLNPLNGPITISLVNADTTTQQIYSGTPSGLIQVAGTTSKTVVGLRFTSVSALSIGMTITSPSLAA